MSEDRPGRVVSGLLLPLGAKPDRLKRLAADAMGVDADRIAEVRPLRISLDGRRRPPCRVVTARVWLDHEEVPAEDLPRPELPAGLAELKPGSAPIVVGTGPAGLWAALRFVMAGQPVVLLERGPALERRHRPVVALRRHGVLDPERNVCFGQGGAGTYSDGKLTIRKRDALVERVQRDLVAFGASPTILVDAYPHVGTDRLIPVLRAMDAFLREAGCDLRFEARVDGLLRTKNGRVRGVRLADGSELQGSCVVLAVGHSARDTFAWLHEQGVKLEPKALAIGARVEHPQALIDRLQYGVYRGHPELEPASYRLTTRVGSRGAFSFCMCPGGRVIPTPTEPDQLNVNGMSGSRRGTPFANSALVISVTPDDFWLERPGDLDEHGPLAGVELLRHLERRAFRAGGGGYRAPAQRLTDFMERQVGDLPPVSSYRPGLTAADMTEVLTKRFAGPLGRAIAGFDRKKPGFVTDEAVLIGVETTTSSPLRILRAPGSLEAVGTPGLFPCGEGAGYAGGIMSSAIDGIRAAEAALDYSA